MEKKQSRGEGTEATQKDDGRRDGMNPKQETMMSERGEIVRARMKKAEDGEVEQ